jgi:hypothetical protein
MDLSHDDLIDRVKPWVNSRTTDGRGIRYGREILVKQGYEPDWVCFGNWQNSFFKELADNMPEGNLQHNFVGVFEAKSNWSDFKSTFYYDSHKGSRTHRLGNWHFIVATAEIYEKHQDYPQDMNCDFWGWLIPKGSGLTMVDRPSFTHIPDWEKHKIGYHVMWGKR